MMSFQVTKEKHTGRIQPGYKQNLNLHLVFPFSVIILSKLSSHYACLSVCQMVVLPAGLKEKLIVMIFIYPEQAVLESGRETDT